MKLAIMQPYFLPYIGYFQLINAVDTFVLYDDVNFINKGYINRNSILLNNKAHLFTLELIGASQNKLINQIAIGDNKNKILKTLEHSYKKAPFFKDSFEIIEKIFLNNETNIARFIGDSLVNICNYLEIKTKIIYSSDIEKNNNLKGQAKILEICKILNAKKYINPIGGLELYNKSDFEKEALNLNFIKTKPITYKQFNNDFVANLSIIDIMMFNSKNDIKKMLKMFDLI